MMSHAATASSTPPPSPPAKVAPNDTSLVVENLPSALTTSLIHNDNNKSDIEHVENVNRIHHCNGQMHRGNSTTRNLEAGVIDHTISMSLKNEEVGNDTSTRISESNVNNDIDGNHTNNRSDGGNHATNAYSEEDLLDDNEDVDTIATIRTSNVTAHEAVIDNASRGSATSKYFDRIIAFKNSNNTINRNDVEGQDNNMLISNHSQLTTASGSATIGNTTGMKDQQQTMSSPMPNIAQPSFTLPQELKKILYEVSKTGKCSSLPWTVPYYFGGNRSISSSEKINKRKAYLRNSKKKRYSSNQERKKSKRQRSDGSSSRSKQLMPSSSCFTPNNTSESPPSKNATLSLSSATLTKNSVGATQAKFSPSSSSSSLDTTNSNQHKTTSTQQQSIRFNENGEKQTSINLGEGRYERKLTSAHTTHSKGEDGDVSSISSTFSHASKKSISSSAGQYLQNRRSYNKDFHPSNYASSCSESISSKGEGSTMSIPSSSTSMVPLCVSLPCSLRGAMRLAVALVLEYSYKHGGYKLSPAEKRRFEVSQQKSMKNLSSPDGSKRQQSSSSMNRDKNQFYGDYSVTPSQMDFAFTERRMRILKMLCGGKKSRSSSASQHVREYTSDSGSSLGSTKRSSIHDGAEGQQHCSGPPFTIQRVAEVLLMPERVSCFFQPILLLQKYCCTCKLLMYFT